MLFATFGQSNSNGDLKMKSFKIKVFSLATALAVVLTLPLSMQAQDAASLFKSKCAGCHGADGTGSAMGKKMGAHDFTSAEVQGMSDAQLADTITNGKNKMPKYASLTPDQVKGLVAYIRTLKK
jgi:mono/diheme cytochrome c family protein